MKLWPFLLAQVFCCLLSHGAAQSAASKGFIQDSAGSVDSEVLNKINEELRKQLEPTVADQLEKWNQQVVSKLNLEELAGSEYGSLAKDNPLGFLSLLHSMPKEEQQAFLKRLGSTLQQESGSACNVYGGTEACMTLPSDSEFARLCPEHDLKVDCAYYAEDMQQIQDNPIAQMKKALQAASEADIADACPECFETQRRIFCFSALPKCGSFSAQVETAILPAAQAVVTAQAEGLQTLEALGKAAPYLLKAMALTLPCKEMCNAMMDTCACGKTKTFGELISLYSAVLPGEKVPQTFLEELFGSLKNKTNCDLYYGRNDEGFVGHCEDLPKQCSNQGTWCGPGKNPVSTLAQDILAGQTASILFGVLKSWTSPSTFEDVAAVADQPAVKTMEEEYMTAGGGASEHHESSNFVVGILTGLVVACIVGAGVFSAFHLFSQRRKQEHARQPQYVAMTEADSLLQPPTAEL